LIAKTAPKLAEEPDATLRLEAARALAGAAKGKGAKIVGPALVKLAGDEAAPVRLAAAAGLAALGENAPKAGPEALRAAWPRADEGEKLALVAAAESLGDDQLIRTAVHDVSPTIRRRGLAAALALKIDVPALLGGALIDPDPSVRREALARVVD